MTNQIIIDELVEEEKETVRRLLVESYQQYEHEYTNSQDWKNYLTNIKASVDNPDVEKILIAKSDGNILGAALQPVSQAYELRLHLLMRGQPGTNWPLGIRGDYLMALMRSSAPFGQSLPYFSTYFFCA